MTWLDLENWFEASGSPKSLGSPYRVTGCEVSIDETVAWTVAETASRLGSAT